jgi:hypothetical protein
MNAKTGWALAALFGSLMVCTPGQAQTPDPATSYYVPEAGPVGAPLTGTDAVQFFRACPNNDGGASLPLSARIKVVLKNSVGLPLAGVPAADIYIKLNGGTDVQGFSGDGADSVIANGVYNTDPACPLLQYVFADAPTDGAGATYITFGGGDPASPGAYLRDPGRKWGHYDSVLPVFANGVVILGRLEEAAGSIGDYVLRLKSFDVKGGLANGNNQGEVVSSVDYNTVKGTIGESDPLSYWVDYDSGGSVGVSDLNMVQYHMHHDCGVPSP